MLNTTFNKCHEYGACAEGYHKLAKSLGGVTKYGKDTPIPLSKILESNGLMDTIWTLRCTIEPSENLLIELACRCAENVLHIYEDKYPNDNRPRKAIESARICITDKSKTTRAAAGAAGDAAWAARDAAWAARDAGAARAAAGAAGNAARAAAGAAGNAAGAARAAARAAAGAAGDAAWAAEKDWQAKTLLELLEASK